MKKFIIAAILAFPSLLHAEDFPWVVLGLADGSEVAVASAGLEITYAGSELRLSSATVAQSLPIANVKTLKFSSENTAIAGLLADPDGQVECYGLDGKSVGTFAGIDRARAALGSGIFVVKSAGKTLKVIF